MNIDCRGHGQVERGVSFYRQERQDRKGRQEEQDLRSLVSSLAPFAILATLAVNSLCQPPAVDSRGVFA